MGIEPTSSAWKAEVLPLNYTRRCFPHPPTSSPAPFSPPPRPSKWWRGKDSNLRRRKPADLQSAPVGRLGTPPRKRAAYSDFRGAECQCILARKLLGATPRDGGASLKRGRFGVQRRDRLSKVPGRGSPRACPADLRNFANALRTRPARPQSHDLPGRGRQTWVGGDGIRREWPARAWPTPRESPQSA